MQDLPRLELITYVLPSRQMVDVREVVVREYVDEAGHSPFRACRDGERLLILVGGGTKKRQHQDIARAKAVWQDYKRRRE